MRRSVCRRWRRYAITTMIVVAPIAIVCAYVSNLLVPTSPLPRTVNAASVGIVNTAAINDSDQTIGISDSDLYDPNLTDEQVIERLQQMQDLGVNTVRVLVPWGAIEPAAPGSPEEVFFPPDWKRIDLIVSQAQQRNMAVLGVLNSTPYWGGQDGQGCIGCYGVAPDPDKFAAFASEAVTRLNTLFPGAISAYEVWNEPNLYQSWLPAPDPVAYTELLKKAYTAIKAADPAALVVAGVFTSVINFGNVTVDPRDFLATMYANGAKGFFDALSFHPYSYQQQFTDGNCANFCQNTPLQQLIDLRQMMIANGDALTKIWATEYGLGTALLSGTEQMREQMQSDWIKNFLDGWATLDQNPAYAYLGTDWLGPAFIYTLQDRLDNSDENGSLGIFKYGADWVPKLAAIMLKQLIDARNAGIAPPSPWGNPANAGAILDPVQALAQAITEAVTQFVNQIAKTVQGVEEAVVKAVTAFFNGLANPGSTTLAALALPVERQQEVAEASGLAAQSIQDETTAKENPEAEKSSAEEPAADQGVGADEATKATEDGQPNNPDEHPAADKPGSSDQSATSDDSKNTDGPGATAPGRKDDESGDVPKHGRGGTKKGDHQHDDPTSDATSVGGGHHPRNGDSPRATHHRDPADGVTPKPRGGHAGGAEGSAAGTGARNAT
ncbi:polysaccharide biosynthesis protein PslG [Mycobacterium sp. URHB0021]